VFPLLFSCKRELVFGVHLLSESQQAVCATMLFLPFQQFSTVSDPFTFVSVQLFFDFIVVLCNMSLPLGLHRTGFLNIFKHVDQLTNKRRVCGPLTTTPPMRHLLHIHVTEVKTSCNNTTSSVFENIHIRGSIHDSAQIKSFSASSLLLNFVFMATRAASLLQNAFSNSIYCAQRGRLRGNFRVTTISNTL